MMSIEVVFFALIEADSNYQNLINNVKFNVLVLELLAPPSHFAKALVQYACVFNVEAKKLQDYQFENLSDYHVVVFGMADAASDLYTFTDAKQKKVCEYLQQGGNVIWSHNHLDWTRAPIKELENLVGIRKGPARAWCDTAKALINEHYHDHPIFRSYYNLTSDQFYQNLFPIAVVHRTYGEFDSKGKSLLNLIANDLNENCVDPYLYLYEGANYKSVFLAAGHTHGYTHSEYELWVNIVAWLVGYVRK